MVPNGSLLNTAYFHLKQYRTVVLKISEIDRIHFAVNLY